MSNYPVIYTPDAIRQAQAAMPSVPLFVDPKIEHPGKSPQRINVWLMILISSTLVIVSFLSAFSIGIWSLALLSIGSVAIALYVCQRRKSYSQRLTRWKQKVRKYEKSKEERAKLLQERQLAVKESKNPEKIAEYRKQQVQQALSFTRSYDGMSSNHRKGPSEPRFENYLNRYFPGKIQTQLKVQNPAYDSGYHYTPDFAYIDSNQNLYIDIEIDEPYNRNGEPIHYIEFRNQQHRDRYFLSRGWLVIRFAEEQVCRWPESCCKTIATEISSVLGNSLPAELANISDLKQIKRWTEAQAQEMAQQNSRDKYL